MSADEEIAEAQRRTAIADVAAERAEQARKYPPERDDEHGILRWSLLVVAASLRASDALDYASRSARRAFWRRKMVQIGALAVAAIEACDRAAAPDLRSRKGAAGG